MTRFSFLGFPELKPGIPRLESPGITGNQDDFSVEHFANKMHHFRAFSAFLRVKENEQTVCSSGGGFATYKTSNLTLT